MCRENSSRLISSSLHLHHGHRGDVEPAPGLELRGDPPEPGQRHQQGHVRLHLEEDRAKTDGTGAHGPTHGGRARGDLRAQTQAGKKRELCNIFLCIPRISFVKLGNTL